MTATVSRLRVQLAASRIPLPVTALTAGEAALLAVLPNTARRRRWLTARHALRRALISAGLPADTSACTFPGRRASVSYSGEIAVAAVVADAPHNVMGIGVDAELSDPPPEAAARIFLTGPERAWLMTVPGQARPGTLLRLWTVKEALFKANSANAGTTLRGYCLADPAARHGTARCATADRTCFHYLTIQVPRGYLSVAVTLPPNGAHPRG